MALAMVMLLLLLMLMAMLMPLGEAHSGHNVARHVPPSWLSVCSIINDVKKLMMAVPWLMFCSEVVVGGGQG